MGTSGRILRSDRLSREIPNLISRLGLSSEQIVDLTIEQTDGTLTAVLDRIGKNAREKGLTAEKLDDLLADESRISCCRY